MPMQPSTKPVSPKHQGRFSHTQKPMQPRAGIASARCDARCSVLELFWQQAEISVCRLRMAVQSLLMAIQRLRMCIQRLQTEISPSTQKTFTMLPERILKGGGKHALCSRLCCAKLCCGLLPPCPSRPNGHIYPSESGKTSIRRQQDIRSETIKASADVRLHTSGCLLDDKREGTTPPLAAAFYPRVN